MRKQPVASRPLSRSPREFRFLGACVVALGLHAGLLCFDWAEDAPAPSRLNRGLEAPALEFIEAPGIVEAPDIPSTDSPEAPFAPPPVPASTSSVQEPSQVAALVAQEAADTSADFSLEGEQELAVSADTPAAPRKRLSLSQLGIGTSPRFEVSPPSTRKPTQRQATPSVAERLQQSFTQSAAKEAQRLGLGITSELKGTLLRASQSVKMEKEGSAYFVFTFGEGGELMSTHHRTLGGAAADWARVSAMVKASLKKNPARLAPQSKGARLSYSVDYSYRLPSGRKKGSGLSFSTVQQFDVADIGATTQAVTKVVLQEYQVF